MTPWLKRFKRSTTPSVAPVASEPSFAEMESQFLSVNEIGIRGTTIFYRPRRQGSFRPERGRLGRFVKQWLVDRDLTHLWDESLVNRFRSWLAISARQLESEQVSCSEKLVD